MKSKSTEIAKQIEELKTRLAEEKRKEAEAQEALMLKLVRKAGCQVEVISFARRLIDQKRAEN